VWRDGGVGGKRRERREGANVCLRGGKKKGVQTNTGLGTKFTGREHRTVPRGAKIRGEKKKSLKRKANPIKAKD